MIKQSLLLVILLVLFCSEVYAESDCKLLGRINNELWIIDSGGKPAQRLTFDEAVKTSKTTATWSPDGKFIAYSPDIPYGEEKAIFIMDNTGREINKIIIDQIRYIDRLVWRTPNFLWSDSNVGKNGGYIDIWKLAPTLSRPVKHEKRIMVFNVNCELSPNNKYMACNSSIDDAMSLEIFDTDKKEYPDADNYYDRDPRTIKLKQIERVDKIRFTSDNANVIIISGDKKYKFNMLDNKLSEIKELPSDVTIKSIPKAVKIKKDEKELSTEVFDMYCNQRSSIPK
ncbi:MAG: hypothetical protein HY752_03410 [Nitrospirae bacterium]|nr:hypothetical protein [Nitrospirota bacterium]